MAPTSSPSREDPSSRVLSSMQRQLAPTVGPEASGGRNREGSAFAGIGDSVAVGRIQYYGRFPFVPPDECWIPARTNPTRLSIIPFGGFHIFIGETADHGGISQVSSVDPTAEELVAAEQIRSEMREPVKDSALDLEISKPTQSAPEQESTVEDQRRSTWVSEVFEKQRCHYVHFLAHSSGSAPPEGNAGSDKEEEIADSILDNLSPLAGDVSPMGSQEYDKWCVEMDAAIAVDA